MGVEQVTLADWLMVIITILVAFISLMAWHVSKLIAWLTGAIESHSSIMLRLEAKRGVGEEPIKVVWWDPTIETPPINRKHGDEADINCIYSYVPPKERKCPPNWLVCWLSGEPN